MSSAIRSCRSMIVVSCAAMTMAACGSAPDVRVADKVQSSSSIAVGKRLLEEGRAVDAVAAFRKRLREDGVDLHGLNGLAIAYSELGKPDLAAEMFGRALALLPDDPATLNNIGFAALRRADTKLARLYLERARDRSSDLDEIGGNLARLALLEASDRTSSRRSAMTRAALMSLANRPAAVTQLSLATDGAGLPGRPIGTSEAWKEETAIVDFTAVIDPFSKQRISSEKTNDDRRK